MNRCSIVGNMCSGGGGGMLLFLAEVKISNSVFWGNRVGRFSNFQDRQIIAPGNDITVEVDHCLIEQSGGSASWNPRLSNITDGGNNLDLDPVFEIPPVFASGGQSFEPVSLSGDFRPTASSPLLHRASPAEDEENLDIRGSQRVFGSAPDIGASEWTGKFTPPVSTLFQVTTGEAKRRSLENLRDLFSFEASNFVLASNSDPDLATVSVHPTDGTLSISWNDSRPTGFADLKFEADFDGVTLEVPLRLELIPGVIFVDRNQTNGGDGLSWETASTHLQDALDIIQPNLSQSIWVAQGTYYPDDGATKTENSALESFNLPSGISLHGGFTGTETNLEQRDPNAHPSILSGDFREDDNNHFDMRNNSEHVVVIENSAEVVTLDGFTVEAGYVNSTGHGCNIRIDQAEALIQNIRLGRSSGVPVVIAGSPKTTFADCDFESLEIYNVVLDVYGSKFTLSSSRIRGLTYEPLGVLGTSFLRINSSETTIESCLFSGNRTGYSLITVNHSSAGDGSLLSSNVNILNSTFSGNDTTPRDNGRPIDTIHPLIRNNGKGLISVADSIIWNNSWNNDTLRTDTVVSNLGGANSYFANCIIENAKSGEEWSDDLGIDGASNTSDPPLFIDPLSTEDAPSPNGDYSLPGGSPAVDRGRTDVLLSAVDALGGQRIIGAGPDLGAIEWDGRLSSPRRNIFLYSGPHGAGQATISLRDSMGMTPGSFSLESNDTNEITTQLDATTGILTLTLDSPTWTGVATIGYSATRENEVFSGEIKATVLPKVLHVRSDINEGRRDGLDWTNAFASLKNALASTIANSGQEVWISEGIYRTDDGENEVPLSRESPFRIPNGISIIGGFSGVETSKDLRDPEAHPSILAPPSERPPIGSPSRSSFNFLAIMEPGPSPMTFLDSLILEGEPRRAVHATYGQILSCQATRTSFKDCIFRKASEESISANYSFLTIEQCRFEDTTGLNASACTYTLTKSHFSNANISLSEGSGMVAECQFSADPTLEIGPAILATHEPEQGLSIRKCSISGFQQGLVATSYSSSPHPIEIIECDFTNNYSLFNGGAVRTFGLTTIIQKCRFQGNRATNNGGAVFIEHKSPENLLEGCLFAGNRADNNGGAFQIGGFGQGDTRIVNCTITNNSAGSEGGAANTDGGNARYEACIITGNTSPDGFQIHPQGRGSNRPIIRNSIVEGTGGNAAWSEPDLQDQGGNLDLPPLSLSPNPNPAPSVGGDYQLQPNSPAIDQAFEPSSLSFDLNDSPRLSGAFVDLGAYEFQFPDIVPEGFSSAFPNLDPNDDDNQNGTTNFAEFAFGADPTTPNPTSFLQLSRNNSVSFRIREDPQIKISYQYSLDLAHWMPLQETNDFEFGPDLDDIEGIQRKLLLTEEFRTRNPAVYFRHQPFPAPAN